MPPRPRRATPSSAATRHVLLPPLFVRTAPEDGYRSISMVNLSYIGFGEDKLPTSLLDSLLTLAAPMSLWTA
ncbi:MAG: hypothetical protein ACLRIS_10040 [Flavonifractor plautii]